MKKKPRPLTTVEMEELAKGVKIWKSEPEEDDWEEDEEEDDDEEEDYPEIDVYDAEEKHLKERLQKITNVKKLIKEIGANNIACYPGYFVIHPKSRHSITVTCKNGKFKISLNGEFELDEVKKICDIALISTGAIQERLTEDKGK